MSSVNKANPGFGFLVVASIDRKFDGPIIYAEVYVEKP